VHLSPRHAGGSVLIRAVLAASLLAGVVGTANVAAASSAEQSRSRVGHGLLHHIVGELPSYQPGQVHWRLSLKLGHWGQTDWETHTITISVLVPLGDLYSVVAHEWSHELQAIAYDQQYWPMIRALNRHFGGGGKSGMHGTEIAADCMAILQGATWTSYTKCHKAAWRHDARRLVHGHRI
jgi:hypothetical protein